MAKAIRKAELPTQIPDSEEDQIPVVPDRSGWPLHATERRSFLNRIRIFPPSVASWRKQLLETLRSEKHSLPLLGEVKSEEISDRLDDGITFLREIAHILALLYGTPDLGNKADPTDELVYILLSRKTPEKYYQETFNALKARFPRWDDLLDAPQAEVEKIVLPGGLPKKKALSLFGTLGKIRETFGSCTLEPARNWSDEKLEEFLCSLPEIEKKSAYCIMMYSFGREVFPADTHVGRVLARLGPYRELGLDLRGFDHKKLQKFLANLIPPPLRYSLHVNLIQHGRAVCQARKPLCDRCEFRPFCRYFREQEEIRIAATDSPTVVDLFCGAGGSSEGFVRAGFKVLAALDSDETAVKTFRFNHPGVPDNHVFCQDIRTLQAKILRKITGKQLDVLVGSPPCQGFSTAGFRSNSTRTGYRPEEDERNHLWEWMVDLALELKPRLFLMENVPGMHSVKRGELSFLEAVAQKLEQEGGYRTEVWKLNAAAFGVPQDRNRYFLVASRLSLMPSRPAQDYQDPRHPDHEALPPITLDEAIFDLPQRRAGEGVAIELWPESRATDDPRFRRYLNKFGILRPSQLLFEHTIRGHNSRDLELYAMLRPGDDSITFLEQHGDRTDLMRYRKDVFDDKYARLRPDRPSKTILAHLAKDGNGYVHPTQVRSLSFREGARVQSFRDDYVFCGPASDQWVQLGNAVPPVMAEAIARSFRRTLERS